MRIGWWGGVRANATSLTASKLGILPKILQEKSKNVIFQRGVVIVTVEKKVVKFLVVLPKGEQKIIKT